MQHLDSPLFYSADKKNYLFFIQKTLFWPRFFCREKKGGVKNFIAIQNSSLLFMYFFFFFFLFLGPWTNYLRIINTAASSPFTIVEVTQVEKSRNDRYTESDLK